MRKICERYVDLKRMSGKCLIFTEDITEYI